MIALLGWLGSALVVTSLIQRDIRRLRQVNLAASVALLLFNLVLGIWSMIVLNVVLAAINGYHLLRERFVGRRIASRIDEPALTVQRQRAAAAVDPASLVRH